MAELKRNSKKLAVDPARREPETPGRVRGICRIGLPVGIVPEALALFSLSKIGKSI